MYEWILVVIMIINGDSNKYTIDSESFNGDDIDHNIGYDGVGVDNSDDKSYYNDKLNS